MKWSHQPFNLEQAAQASGNVRGEIDASRCPRLTEVFGWSSIQQCENSRHTWAGGVELGSIPDSCQQGHQATGCGGVPMTVVSFAAVCYSVSLLVNRQMKPEESLFMTSHQGGPICRTRDGKWVPCSSPSNTPPFTVTGRSSLLLQNQTCEGGLRRW